MTDPQLPERYLKIGFVGAGNMARALIAGLMQSDDSGRWQIHAADPSPEQLALIQRHWPSIQTFTNSTELPTNLDILLLAVKPQILPEIVRQIAHNLEKSPLILSVAAGIRLNTMSDIFGENAAIVRCMPNTPALVRAGATGLFANQHCTDSHKSWAEQLMRSVGITHWVSEEAQLDNITALSGSGPAYYFRVMEAMQQAAEDMGFDEKTAKLFVVQTAYGAAKLALESEDSPASLRQNVTSKGGTTEAALAALEAADIDAVLATAMQAAVDRSKTLG